VSLDRTDESIIFFCQNRNVVFSQVSSEFNTANRVLSWLMHELAEQVVDAQSLNDEAACIAWCILSLSEIEAHSTRRD